MPSTEAPRLTNRFCIALAETLNNTRMAIMIVNVAGTVFASIGD